MKTALFIIIPVIAFLYFPAAFEEFETPKSWAFVAFALFACFWVKWREVLSDKIAIYLALFTGSAAISTVYSIDKHVSFYGNVKCPAGLLVIFSYLVFYLAASKVLHRKRNADDAISIMIGCGGVVSLYAISQVLGIDFVKWGGTLERFGYVRPMSTLGHPNFMAAFVGMILPFSLWRTDSARSILEKRLFQGASILMVTAVLLSLSRGMVVAMLFGVLTYYFISGAVVRNFWRFFKATVTALIALLVLNPSFRQGALDRYPAFFSPGYARTQYLTAAVNIWKKNPIVGIGTDAYEFGFQHERTAHYWVVEHAGSPHRSHNDFLNVLATQGLLGALIAILATIAVFYRCRRRSPYRAPAVACIVSFYVAGLTSFTVIPTGIIFILCLALLKGKPVENYH